MADPNIDSEKLSRRIYIQQNIKTNPVDLEKVKEMYIKKFGSSLFVSLCGSAGKNDVWCTILTTFPLLDSHPQDSKGRRG